MKATIEEAVLSSPSPLVEIRELKAGEGVHVGAGGFLMKLSIYGDYLLVDDNIPAEVRVVKDRDLEEEGARSEMFNLRPWSRYSKAAPGTRIVLTME